MADECFVKKMLAGAADAHCARSNPAHPVFRFVWITLTTPHARTHLTREVSDCNVAAHGRKLAPRLARRSAETRRR
jgi:hypothetical protein